MNKHKKCEFTIIPQKNSDYIIIISNIYNINNISIECYYSPNEWSKTSVEHQPSIEGEDAIQFNDNTVYFNFVLKKDFTYTFCINNTSILPQLHNYTVKISQNNWIFAPNGAFTNYSDNYNNIGLWLGLAVYYENFEEYYNNYLSQFSMEEKINKFNGDESRYLINGLILGTDVYKEVNNVIGIHSTYTGFIWLIFDKMDFYEKIHPLINEKNKAIFDAFKEVGNVATVVGATTTMLSTLDALANSRVASALAKGSYNVKISTTHEIGSYYIIDCEEWNKKYINKYHKNSKINIQFLDINEV